MFDWTISIGSLLSAGSVAVGAIVVVVLLREQVSTIGERLGQLEHQLSRLTDILIQQGRQDERMTAMDARIVNQGARLDDLTVRFNKKTDT